MTTMIVKDNDYAMRSHVPVSVASRDDLRTREEAVLISKIAAQLHRQGKCWKAWPVVAWTPVRNTLDPNDPSYIGFEPCQSHEAQAWMLEVKAVAEPMQAQEEPFRERVEALAKSHERWPARLRSKAVETDA